MTVNWYDIFVQSLGFTAFALALVAYQIKDTRRTQLLFAPGCFLYGAQFILLGSVSGAAVMFAAGTRDLFSVYCSDRTLKIVSGVYLAFVWLITLFLFRSWVEFLMPVSGTFSTIAVLYRDRFFRYRAFLMGRQAATMLFQVWVGSLGGVLHLAFTFLSNVVGTYRYYQDKKTQEVV